MECDNNGDIEIQFIFYSCSCHATSTIWIKNMNDKPYKECLVITSNNGEYAILATCGYNKGYTNACFEMYASVMCIFLDDHYYIMFKCIYPIDVRL